MKTLLMSTIAVAMMLAAGSVFASDYSQYSNEELHKMRGTMQNATAEERESFMHEWQERTRNMTQEEKQDYMGKQGKGMKSGQGMMNKGYEKRDYDDNYEYGKGKRSNDDDYDEYRKGKRSEHDSYEYGRGKRSGEESGYGSGDGYGKGSGRN